MAVNYKIKQVKPEDIQLAPDALHRNETVPMQAALDMENRQAAEENAASCIVRVEIPDAGGGWFGTAVVWDQTEEEVVFAASGHLLIHAGEDRKIQVFFRNETGNTGGCTAETDGISERADVGFFTIDKKALSTRQIESLRYARLHQRIYDTLSSGDSFFAIGCSEEGTADITADFTLESTDFRDGELEGEMLLLNGTASPGMSGSGVFDGYGNFTGLLTAGRGEKTVALPMPLVNEAYREIYERSRNTADYG